MLKNRSMHALEPEHRKARIISAAKKVLAERGSMSFNVGNIAREADVAVGLISYYFGGIAGLFEIVLLDIAALKRPSSNISPSSEQEALRCILDLLVRHFDPTYYSRDNLLIWMPVMDHFSRKKDTENIMNMRDEQEIKELGEALSVLATHRNVSIDAMDVSRTFFSLLDGLWLRWCYSGRMDDAEWEKAAAKKFLELYIGPLTVL